MARPAPKIMMSHSHDQVFEQILEAKGMFIVVFEGQPFNIRRVNEKGEQKYIRTTYPAAAHANRLAARLNTQFKCEGFEVVKLGDN